MELRECEAVDENKQHKRLILAEIQLMRGQLLLKRTFSYIKNNINYTKNIRISR